MSEPQSTEQREVTAFESLLSALEALLSDAELDGLSDHKTLAQVKALVADEREAQPTEPPHGCGLCNGPLRFDGHDADGLAGYTCKVCGWTHTARDCCEQVNRRGDHT